MLNVTLRLAMLFIFIFSAGCATQQKAIPSPIVAESPIKSISWRGRITSKNFTITRDEMVKNILRRVGGMDEHEMAFAINYINLKVPTKEVIAFTDESPCQDKRNFFSDKLYAVAKKFDTAVFLRNNSRHFVYCRSAPSSWY